MSIYAFTETDRYKDYPAFINIDSESISSPVFSVTLRQRDDTHTPQIWMKRDQLIHMAASLLEQLLPGEVINPAHLRELCELRVKAKEQNNGVASTTASS